MLLARMLVVCVVSIGGAAGAVTLRCEPCSIPLFGTTFRVTGTVADAPFAVAIVGYAKRWKLGAIELRDVAVTARDRGARIDACVAANFNGSRVRACSRMPRSLEAWTRLRAVDVVWHVDGASASGHGSARVAWAPGGDIRIEHGMVELAVAPRAIGAFGVGPASLVAELDGNVSRSAFAVHGRLNIASVAAGGMTLRGIEIPLELQTEFGTISPRGAVVATLDEATIAAGVRTLHFVFPTVVVHDARPFAWDALPNDEHRFTWTSIAGLPIGLGAGSVGFELSSAGARVTSGHVRLFGGELVLAPFSLRSDAPFDLGIRLDGLSVAQVVSFATGDRLVGTGLLDGELVVHHDDSGFGLERASVVARKGGELRLRESPWRSSPADAPLPRRLEVALADFTYDRLTCVIQPRGHDPEAILLLHGRGTRVPQELELAVNIRGARALARLP